MKPLLSCRPTIIAPICKNNPSSTVLEHHLTADLLTCLKNKSTFACESLKILAYKNTSFSPCFFFLPQLLLHSPLFTSHPLLTRGQRAMEAGSGEGDGGLRQEWRVQARGILPAAAIGGADPELPPHPVQILLPLGHPHAWILLLVPLPHGPHRLSAPHVRGSARGDDKRGLSPYTWI